MQNFDKLLPTKGIVLNAVSAGDIVQIFGKEWRGPGTGDHSYDDYIFKVITTNARSVVAEVVFTTSLGFRKVGERIFFPFYRWEFCEASELLQAMAAVRID